MAALGISVLGSGRMGRELLRLLPRPDDGLELAAVWSRRPLEVAALVSDDLEKVVDAGDVVVDFTLADVTASVAASVQRARKPLVCGVSGLDSRAMAALQAAAESVPVFYERNMSVGVALLCRIVAEAGAVLGTGVSAEITDLHHAGKRDAPSGTALMLGEVLKAARGRDDIVYTVHREGTHPGHHSVRLTGNGETLTLAHEVGERRVFAAGALRAARWLHGRAPGLYGMQDLLG